MRRVVVTGLGIVSSMGNNKEVVLNSLKENRSGISFVPEMAAMGYKCQLYGTVKDLDLSPLPKRWRRTMPPVALFATFATLEAVKDAGISQEVLSSKRTAVVLGTSVGGINTVSELESVIAGGQDASRLGGAGLVKIMNSTAASNVAAYLGVKGRVYSFCAACASGPVNIGHAYELIKLGYQDLCICGGSDERAWRQIAISLNNWGAMPVSWNDHPEKACRPFDKDREGLILAEGAGVFVLEPLEAALKRGAPIYAEIIGYGMANDGLDMHVPSGEGLKDAICLALESAGVSSFNEVDYVNAHGPGTKVGDEVEVKVVREIFGSNSPLISSTKSLNGHSMAAAGAHEAIHTLLMMREGFVTATANLENIAPECAGVNHVQSTVWKPFRTAMSWNMGLGGTNSCLVFRTV